MAETVRVAVNQGDTISWPKRCPKCGSTENLIAVECSPARESFSYWGTHASVRTESVQLTFFACNRHAYANEVGIFLLKKTAVMFFLRMLIYAVFMMIPLAIVQLVSRQMPLSYYTHNSAALYLMLFGLLGVVLILWARSAASVLPLRLDADRDIVIIRFADNTYARDFKRANPRSTHRLLTRAPPFFMRPDFWKVILVVLAVFFISRMSGRN
ncbi:hypothetical protein AAKU55_000888 [Oxalobacteraceae bacterium GrIS 1.11]